MLANGKIGELTKQYTDLNGEIKKVSTTDAEYAKWRENEGSSIESESADLIVNDGENKNLENAIQ